jgi:hypothetical protein
MDLSRRHGGTEERMEKGEGTTDYTDGTEEGKGRGD